jgi:hypothetical protein
MSPRTSHLTSRRVRAGLAGLALLLGDRQKGFVVLLLTPEDALALQERGYRGRGTSLPCCMPSR